MKNVTLNLLVLSSLIFSGMLYAQDKRANQRINPPSSKGIYRCVSDEYNAKLLQKNPNMMGSPAFEKKLKRIIAERKLARIQSASGTTLVRIPVVVHVIHNGTSVGIEVPL